MSSMFVVVWSAKVIFVTSAKQASCAYTKNSSVSVEPSANVTSIFALAVNILLPVSIIVTCPLLSIPISSPPEYGTSPANEVQLNNLAPTIFSFPS